MDKVIAPAPLLKSLHEGFTGSFAGTPRFFSAPGRTEIGGNHTDHQHGCVLAASVTLAAYAAALPREDGRIIVHSDKYAPVVVDLASLEPRKDEREKSAGLVRGVAQWFSLHGFSVGGFEAFTSNEVPGGSGLSSSAAFEVLIGAVFSGLFNGGSLSSTQLAIAGQYAENVHFGKPCGLMDQMASATGGVVAIDFADPAEPVISPLSFDFEAAGYALCITDTGAYHDDLGGEYAAIPAEMCAVAELFGKKHLRQVEPETFYARLGELRGQASDRALLRAMHFFDDNARAAEEAERLRRGDIDGFLRLIDESGRSSWELLQNISPSGSVNEQPVALALALSRRLLGGRGASRVHGGGFAGTIQAFVPLDLLDAYKSGVEALCGVGSCRVLGVRAEGACELVAK